MRIYINRILTNANVTEHNFDVIKSAADRTGLEVVDFATIDTCIKQGTKLDIYIVTGIPETIKLALRGRKKLIYWVQGILPEESLLRHSSSLRFRIVSLIEKLALKSSKHLLLVSEAMHDHYVTKYGSKTVANYSVFPCYNTDIAEEAFKPTEKYSQNTFVYAGGLAEWQCFDETLDIYKKIEDWNIPDTKLLILTANKDLAQNKISERSIRNCEIGFVPKEDLPKVMAKAKFGFVIRKDSPINRVSTPTKISSYLSCGLIPIFGESVLSFKTQSEKMRFAIPYSDFEHSSEKIKYFMLNPIKNEEVLHEYRHIFDTYLSDSYYENQIRNIITNIANESN